MRRSRDILRKGSKEKKERKQNERIQYRKNRTEDSFDIGRFYKIATSSSKLFVNRFNLHKIKNEILRDYSGDFEMIVDIAIGKHKQTTAMTFKKKQTLRTLY